MKLERGARRRGWECESMPLYQLWALFLSDVPGLSPACDFLCYFLSLGIVSNVDSVNMDPKPLLQILKWNSPHLPHIPEGQSKT